MPKTELIIAGRVAKLNQEWLNLVREKAHRQKMEKIYHRTSDYCCQCGTHISTAYGEPLGRYFVMDKNGCFYCMNCDKHFGEGNEEIYVPIEDM
jgi:predicted SprT family Zn-dependent metalloprotease